MWQNPYVSILDESTLPGLRRPRCFNLGHQDNKGVVHHLSPGNSGQEKLKDKFEDGDNEESETAVQEILELDTIEIVFLFEGIDYSCSLFRIMLRGALHGLLCEEFFNSKEPNRSINLMKQCIWCCSARRNPHRTCCYRRDSFVHGFEDCWWRDDQAHLALHGLFRIPWASW